MYRDTSWMILAHHPAGLPIYLPLLPLQKKLGLTTTILTGMTTGTIAQHPLSLISTISHSWT